MIYYCGNNNIGSKKMIEWDLDFVIYYWSLFCVVSILSIVVLYFIM